MDLNTDLTDPALESSVKREEIDITNFKAGYGYILLGIGITFLLWVIYAVYSARLDTRPNKAIEINPNLQKPVDTGHRPEPISETI